MADLLPFPVDRAQHLDSLVPGCVDGDEIESGDKVAFSLEVSGFDATDAVAGLFFLFEEVVTCGKKAFPDIVAVFLCDSADSLPLFLKSDKLIGRAAPVSAVLQGFGTFAERDFLGKIGGETVARGLEILGFGGKETVACGTEAGKELVVELA